MIPISHPGNRPGSGKAGRFCLAIFLSLALGACASQAGMQASKDIALSETMLANAIRNDAARVAPAQVSAARIEVDAAREAFAHNDFELASLIAREAQADAAVAESMARTASTVAAVNALREESRRLRADLTQSQ